MKDTYANALGSADVSQGKLGAVTSVTMRRDTALGDRPTALCRHLGELVVWLVQGYSLPRILVGNPTSFLTKSESHLTLGEGRSYPRVDPDLGKAGLISQSSEWSVTRYLHLSRNLLCSP